MLEQKFFGTTKEGEEVYRYTLTNRAGTRVSAISYGAYLTEISVPDKNGRVEDVTLGFRTLKEYEEMGGYPGACVGRYANRIGGAAFSLHGIRYELDRNDGENSLHGGFRGWSKRVWHMEDTGTSALRFSLVSGHMDSGYPGEMHASVTYRLTEENVLEIEYEATSDRDTIFNPTNHSYFNLTGRQGGEDVLRHYVQIAASTFTPVSDAASIPTGEIRPVEGTPMDFRTAKQIGRDIEADDDQLRFGGGYDHNWLPDGEGYRKIAVCWDETSGRRMTVWSDLPGVQMYTGNFLDGSASDKLGQPMLRRTGVCFETQFAPDSPNRPEFASPLLKGGRRFTSKTAYAFDVIG